MLRRSNRNATGCKGRRGINRSAALWPLCRHRHKAHATKARHRLNRDFGLSKFGNTSYAREEIVAELTSVFLGQELGFTAHTLELNAAYLYNWLRVLRSDKTAIFRHAADAQRACDYLIARSEAGRAGRSAEAA
jgi:antirestriction protein ArdC